MPRTIPLVLAVLLSLAGQTFLQQAFMGKALAQLTPPAGTAGAGMAPINGIPYGPANPRVLSDPSGIGNASNLPPLRSNSPAITVPQAPIVPSSRAVSPSYPYASRPPFSAHAVESKGKTSPRRKGHRQVSSFTGICRGC